MKTNEEIFNDIWGKLDQPFSGDKKGFKKGFLTGFLTACDIKDKKISELEKHTGFSTYLSGKICNNCEYQDRDQEIQKLREQLKEKDNEIVKLKNHYSDELKKTRDHFAPWGDRYQELKLELQKEQLCTQFYADRSLYIEAVEGDGFTGLPDSDCTRCEEEYILWGGKRARETIKNRKVL